MVRSTKVAHNSDKVNRGLPVYGEAVLVGMLREKNEKGFAYLYDNYSGALYSVILRIVPDRHTAADILQELFMSLYKNMDSYDPKKSRLYTWMLRIAKNLAIDTLRSSIYRNNLGNIVLVPIDGPPCMAMVQGIDHIGIKHLLLGLKPKYRLLIELNYLQGYTKPEISDMLGIPLGTVKTRIGTGLKTLRAVV